MTLKTIEEFEKEIEAERERLRKDHAVVDGLPTKGVVVRWIGEGDFESDGATRKPDIERELTLIPHIVHSPFRGAEHVVFRVPDSYEKPRGERVFSSQRETFVRAYYESLMNACAPHLIDIVAIRGHYASHVPETFDYLKHKNHEDAHEISRGRFEVSAKVGKDYSLFEVTFYIRTETNMVVKISLDLSETGFSRRGLMPRARYGGRNNIVRWDVPENTGACNCFERAGASYGVPDSYALEWLFDTRNALEAIILPQYQ